MRWTNLFYNEGDLTHRFQNFNGGSSLFQRMLRQALLLLNLVNITFILYLYEIEECKTKLTNWMLMFNTLWILFSILCTNLGKKAPIWMLALHHIFFQSIVGGHCIDVSVYWTLLHKEEVKKERGSLFKRSDPPSKRRFSSESSEDLQRKSRHRKRSESRERKSHHHRQRRLHRQCSHRARLPTRSAAASQQPSLRTRSASSSGALSRSWSRQRPRGR